MINDSNDTNQTLTQTDNIQTLSDSDTSSNQIPREDLASRLERARLSMEGPERTLRRERSETEDKVETERKKLEDQLSSIAKDKEKYEINWVVLDNKQSELKKLLDPIKNEEEKIELEEERLESQEHTTSDVLERQNIEKKRWAIQDQRKEIEKQKWSLEDKILVTSKELEKNTLEYQKLLDDEESIRRKIDNLEYELDVVEQQLKLQKESQLNKESEQEIEKERVRRLAELNQEAKKVEITQPIEIEKEVEPIKSQSTVASNISPEIKLQSESVSEEVTDRKPLMSELEADQKERAELEIKRQAAMEKLKLEETPVIEPKKEIILDEKPQSIIDDITTQRNSILESARQKAKDYESQVVSTPEKPSPNVIDLSQTPKLETDINRPKNISEVISNPLSLNIKSDSSSNTKDLGANMSKLRTFKTDIESSEEITDQEKAEARKKFPWLK